MSLAAALLARNVVRFGEGLFLFSGRGQRVLDQRFLNVVTELRASLAELRGSMRVAACCDGGLAAHEAGEKEGRVVAVLPHTRLGRRSSPAQAQ